MTESKVHVLVSDADWRLIMKSLAYFAGLPVTRKPEDQIRAAELSPTLLRQRWDGAIIRLDGGTTYITSDKHGQPITTWRPGLFVERDPERDYDANDVNTNGPGD